MSEESKAYRLVNPETMKVVISKDVIFEEQKAWDWSQVKEKENVDEELTWGNYDLFDEEYDFVDDFTTADDEIQTQEQVISEPGPSSTLAREGRQRRTPSYLQDYVLGEELDSEDEELNAMELHDQDPSNYEEAIKEDKWKKAMDLEIQMIEKNQTWCLVDLPKNAKCIGVKWVFKTKLNEKGDIEKHKARLVVRGYGQEFGVDYMEVYAPVARMDTIRLMIAIAAQKGWSIFQMDVKSAFLYGTLQEDVYVQQPQGYVVEGNEHKVYKLQKALYGLKQAPRAWFSRIETYFIKGEFKGASRSTPYLLKKDQEVNYCL